MNVEERIFLHGSNLLLAVQELKSENGYQPNVHEVLGASAQALVTVFDAIMETKNEQLPNSSQEESGDRAEARPEQVPATGTEGRISEGPEGDSQADQGATDNSRPEERSGEKSQGLITATSTSPTQANSLGKS